MYGRPSGPSTGAFLGPLTGTSRGRRRGSPSPGPHSFGFASDGPLSRKGTAKGSTYRPSSAPAGLSAELEGAASGTLFRGHFAGKGPSNGAVVGPPKRVPRGPSVEASYRGRIGPGAASNRRTGIGLRRSAGSSLARRGVAAAKGRPMRLGRARIPPGRRRAVYGALEQADISGPLSDCLRWTAGPFARGPSKRVPRWASRGTGPSLGPFLDGLSSRTAHWTAEGPWRGPSTDLPPRRAAEGRVRSARDPSRAFRRLPQRPLPGRSPRQPPGRPRSRRPLRLPEPLQGIRVGNVASCAAVSDPHLQGPARGARGPKSSSHGPKCRRPPHGGRAGP
ncbi:hypothetical protein M885DRAFT_2504 [Pelagophyceae sp. CCMP2097]|nr:hypothetical protein M885DRAFT_2504 [Pelagophyceae sp. CCMP2097]